MKGKIITVFGAAGFVGRTLIEHLAKKGALIRAVVTDTDKALFLKVMGEPGQITLFTVDFLDHAQVESLCAHSWAVVNLIGTLYEKKHKTYDFIHVDIPEAIARACQVKRVDRFVHISAIGANPESDSDYLCTKGLGEERVQQLFPSVTIVRPSIIFGPNDRFFNQMARVLVLNPLFPIFGRDNTKLQPVYVGDASSAILALLEAPDTRAQIYELGGPKVYTFKALIELTLKLIKRKRKVITLPYWIGQIIGTLLQIFPNPPLTSEQVKLLQKDNVVDPQAKSFKDLSIVPIALEAILPAYLKRYQPSF